jgi:hypothetical protein
VTVVARSNAWAAVPRWPRRARPKESVKWGQARRWTGMRNEHTQGYAAAAALEDSSNVLWMMRVGLVLQFLSLWLVTPEIVGNKRMNDAREWVNRVPDKVQERVESITFPLLIGAAVGVLGAAISAVIAILGIPQTPGYSFAPRKVQDQFARTAVKWTLIGSVSLIVICIAVAIIAISSYFITKLACKVTERATESMHTLAVVGAVLFTAGFVVSLLATWMQPPTAAVPLK